MSAINGLAGGGDHRRLERLVGGEAVRQPLPVHLPATRPVQGQDRGAGRARQVAAHDDLHRQDLEATADDDVRVRVAQDVIGADVGGLLEGPAGDAIQDLTLERDAAQHPVEGRQPVRCDQDAPPVRQVVVVAHLAAVEAGQARVDRLPQHMMGAGRQPGFIHLGHRGLPYERNQVFQGEPRVARDLCAGGLNRLAGALQIVDASGEHILLQGEERGQIRLSPAEQLCDAGQRQSERLEGQHLVQSLNLAWAVDAPARPRTPRAHQALPFVKAQRSHADAKTAGGLAGTQEALGHPIRRLHWTRGL